MRHGDVVLFDSGAIHQIPRCQLPGRLRGYLPEIEKPSSHIEGWEVFSRATSARSRIDCGRESPAPGRRRSGGLCPVLRPIFCAALDELAPALDGPALARGGHDDRRRTSPLHPWCSAASATDSASGPTSIAVVLEWVDRVMAYDRLAELAFRWWPASTRTPPASRRWRRSLGKPADSLELIRARACGSMSSAIIASRVHPASRSLNRPWMITLIARGRAARGSGRSEFGLGLVAGLQDALHVPHEAVFVPHSFDSVRSVNFAQRTDDRCAEYDHTDEQRDAEQDVRSRARGLMRRTPRAGPIMCLYVVDRTRGCDRLEAQHRPPDHGLRAVASTLRGCTRRAATAVSVSAPSRNAQERGTGAMRIDPAGRFGLDAAALHDPQIRGRSCHDRGYAQQFLQSRVGLSQTSPFSTSPASSGFSACMARDSRDIIVPGRTPRISAVVLVSWPSIMRSTTTARCSGFKQPDRCLNHRAPSVAAVDERRHAIVQQARSAAPRLHFDHD